MSEQIGVTPPKRASGGLKEIAGFQLIEKIGQGGMGTVYKARQISMDRIVALKVLPPSIAQDASFLERFQREARASARLNHPHIVSGIDVGHDASSGLWYFAMEYVDGLTLTSLLESQKTIAEHKALMIVRQIASALICLSENGMVHRDIKPDNILLTAAGEPKLADLGLARQTQEDVSLTQSGTMMGTPHYMSPEQARGEATNVDIRTDLYSLGATLFHMVTGKTPFDGPTAPVILMKHLREAPPFANHVNPAISESTSRMIQRLMQKEKERRFQTPQELIVQIDRILSGRVTARQAPMKTTGPRAPIVPVNSPQAAGDPVQLVLPRYLIPGLLVAGLFIVAAGGIFLLMQRSDTVRWAGNLAPPKTAPAHSAPAVQPAAATANPAEAGLREKLEELLISAREYEKTSPDSFTVAVKKYELVIARARGTPFEAGYLDKAQEAANRLNAQRQAAVDRAWKAIEQQAEPRLAAGDVDVAIRIFSDLPPQLEELLREKSAARVNALRSDASQKIREAMDAAEQALQGGNPQKGLEALTAVAAIRLAPLSGQAAELKKRLQDELAGAGEMEKKRAQLELEGKLNAHLQCFDAALIGRADLVAAKEAAAAAQGDPALKSHFDGQTAALGELVKALEDLERQEAAALKALEGQEFTAGKDKGVVSKVDGGAITLSISLPGMGEKAKAQKTIKLTELSAEQRSAIFKNVKPVDTPAGTVAGVVAKLRQAGVDLTVAEETLNAEPAFPLAAHYLELVRIKRLGVTEVAAEKSWPELEQVAGRDCSGAEQGKALQSRLDDWTTAYGATVFARARKPQLDEWAAKAARAQAVNLVVNGGFETGSVEPWSVGGNGSCIAVSEAAHSGRYGLRLLGPAPRFGVALTLRGASEPLTQGETYAVSFHYRFPSPERRAGRAGIPGHRLLDPEQGIAPAGSEWQLFTGEFIARGEAGFWIDAQGNVELQVDDICISRRRPNGSVTMVSGAGTPERVAPAPVEKQPVPATEALTTAEKQIKDAFREDYPKRGAADRVTLAQRLMKVAGESRSDPAARYVALREAKDLAAAAGDYATASDAIEALGDLFKINGGEFKQAAFSTAAKAVTAPEDAERLLTAGMDLLNELAGSSNFDAALKLPTLLDDLARRARNIEAAKTLQARTRELREQQAEWNRVKPMMDKLATHPDDPDASLAVGRYHAFSMGDWEKALPLLAKCSVPGLKDAATRDRQGPQEAEAQADLGDLWWSLAEKETGATKTVLQNRALVWYSAALNELSPMRKIQVEKRLQNAALSATGPALLSYKEGLIRSITLEEPAQGVRFLPTGRLGLAGTASAMIVVDLETGQKIRSIPVPSRALSVDFSRDGKLLVATGEWGGPRYSEAAVWNLATGAELCRFKQGEVNMSSVAFLPDGRAVVIAAPNWQPALYQVQDGRCLLQRIEPPSHRQGWSDDGTVFLGNNALIEGRTGKVLQRFELPVNATAPECMALSPDKRWAAFSSRTPQQRNASITVHEVGSGRMVQQIQPQAGQHESVVTASLAFTPDGRRLVAGVNGNVRVFEIGSGREVLRWEHRWGTVADVSSDGRFVVATGPGSTVRLYGLPR